MILDTNAVSAFFEEVPGVCVAVGGSEVLGVPSIVLGEFRFGLSSSRLRAELEARLGRLERLADVLCVDAETARHYGVIRRELKDAGTPIPDNDLWIAALVRQHGMALLSNDAHFDHVKNLTRIGW
ncbi:MAG: tRNA(fMet)-specific endonuclease VapC [Chthoniobacter sp.]|nr:tRNA(fMet)-specific endonuclease VapC [Chthoniobacter sp.]